jgi:DNA-binding NtrC family response regulator
MHAQPSKILVVDDDPGVLMLLRATLSATRHQVICCATPKEAIQQLAKSEFDLILTDYMMPGMTGLELLDVAKTSSPHAIRFLLTAVATLDVAVQAMKEGKLDRLIRKPWGTAALLHAVEEAAYEREVRKAQESEAQTTAATDADAEAPASTSTPSLAASAPAHAEGPMKTENLDLLWGVERRPAF